MPPGRNTIKTCLGMQESGCNTRQQSVKFSLSHCLSTLYVGLLKDGGASLPLITATETGQTHQLTIPRRRCPSGLQAAGRGTLGAGLTQNSASLALNSAETCRNGAAAAAACSDRPARMATHRCKDDVRGDMLR